MDYTPAGVRSSVQRSLARLHTSFLDTVYVHDVELIADTRAPRTAGNHLSALLDDDEERTAYGLAAGQEGDVCGDGDREVLGAVEALREMQAEGLVIRVGISGERAKVPLLLACSLSFSLALFLSWRTTG